MPGSRRLTYPIHAVHNIRPLHVHAVQLTGYIANRNPGSKSGVGEYSAMLQRLIVDQSRIDPFINSLVRQNVASFDAVVRGFLGDGNVMHVTFTHPGN